MSSLYMFRTVEQWKTALVTLPDTTFFDLVRSNLGNINSPFNKQRLCEELIAHLSRRDVQKTIESYIDKNDHLLIAAISILNDPTIEEVTGVLAPDYSYSFIHSIIFNLEERLIVFRLCSNGIYRLYLNPLLKKILAPFIACKSILFPETKPHDCFKTAKDQLNDLKLCAIFAFCASNNQLFNNDGVIKKAFNAEIKRLFPKIEFKAIVSALRFLGLLDDYTIQTQGKAFSLFASLLPCERLIYIACGIYLATLSDVELPKLPDAPFITATIIQSLLNEMGGNAYKFSCIHRLSALVELNLYKQLKKKNLYPLKLDLLINALCKTGILIKDGDYWYKNDLFDLLNDNEQTKGPFLTFDSAMSFVVFPEIMFNDAVRISLFCNILDTQTATRFCLTRESVALGFNSGLTYTEMINILTKLSGTLDENIELTLKDWYMRYKEVSIFDGITLVLSPERLYLSVMPPLVSLIKHNPVPGVFIIDKSDKEAAIAALKKSGIDTVSEYLPKKETDNLFNIMPPAGLRKIANIQSGLPVKENDANQYKELFKSFLDKEQIDEISRAELRNRIEKRIVVSKRQLKNVTVRYEKLQAASLDFAGKLAIAKQAMAFNEIVELDFQNESGETVHLFGKPFGIEKQASDTILSLVPPEESQTGSDKEFTRVHLGKIRLIRRIKKSIFSS